MQVDKVSLGAKLSSEPVVASGAAPRPSSIIEIFKIIIEKILKILKILQENFEDILFLFSFYLFLLVFRHLRRPQSYHKAFGLRAPLVSWLRSQPAHEQRPRGS